MNRGDWRGVCEADAVMLARDVSARTRARDTASARAGVSASWSPTCAPGSRSRGIELLARFRRVRPIGRQCEVALERHVRVRVLAAPIEYEPAVQPGVGVGRVPGTRVRVGGDCAQVVIVCFSRDAKVERALRVLRVEPRGARENGDRVARSTRTEQRDADAAARSARVVSRLAAAATPAPHHPSAAAGRTTSRPRRSASTRPSRARWHHRTRPARCPRRCPRWARAR